MCKRQYILNCRKYIYFFSNNGGCTYPTNLQTKTYLLVKPSTVNFSSSSSAPFLKKYRKFLFSGFVLTSASLAGYFFLKSKPQEVPVVTDTSDKTIQKYVDPNLDANLALLKQFGDIPYLIVGAGTAAFAAIRAIRANDPYSKIVIIGEEQFFPYMRPPLTKELWFTDDDKVTEKLAFKQWSGRERSLFFEKDAFYCSVQDLLERKNGGVSVIRGLKVVQIDPSHQVVYFDNGKSLSYKKCLLVPGSLPKTLPVFNKGVEDIKNRVSTFKTIEDFKKLNNTLEKIKSVTIIGGGFLGSELACALGKTRKDGGLEVIQMFPESGNMWNILPEYLSRWSTEKVRAEGVHVIPEATVINVSKDGNKMKLHLNKGNDVITDHVVIAVGSEPNTELAKEAGLEIDEIYGGYLVNSELEARKNLWIAGDAASFYDKKLGRRRTEHHDHAIITGRLAGMNMAGKAESLEQQSMFWSDLGPDIGYEAIGIIDSSLPTVGIFVRRSENITPEDPKNVDFKVTEEPEPKKQLPATEQNNFQKGIIFYLRNERIVGILLWNVFGQMHVARQILSEVTTADNLVEVGKLFKFSGIVDEDL